MRKQVATPRTDRFVAERMKIMLREEDFESRAAMMRVVAQMSAMIMAWADFSRELEQEVNASVPREWGQRA